MKVNCINCDETNKENLMDIQNKIICVPCFFSTHYDETLKFFKYIYFEHLNKDGSGRLDESKLIEKLESSLVFRIEKMAKYNVNDVEIIYNKFIQYTKHEGKHNCRTCIEILNSKSFEDNAHLDMIKLDSMRMTNAYFKYDKSKVTNVPDQVAEVKIPESQWVRARDYQ